MLSLLQACGRGYYVVGILGVGEEPTNHALRDLVSMKAALEKWGRPIILLFTDTQQAKKFDVSQFNGLPGTVKYGIDKNRNIQNEIVTKMKISAQKGLPVFVIADTFNRVVFISQGYNTTLGEQMLKIIRGL